MNVLEYLPYAVISALIGIVVLHYRSVQKGKLIPRATVDLMVKHYDDRYDDLVVQHAERLTAKDTELDKVWAALHLETEAKNQLGMASREQSTATANAATAMMESMQRVLARSQAEQPEVTSGSPGT